MENDKVKIQICMGTTCFVMGAAKLQELEKYLPPQFRGKVEISAQPCLNVCQDSGYLKAPFVKINDELIDGATVGKILEKLEEIIV